MGERKCSRKRKTEASRILKYSGRIKEFGYSEWRRGRRERDRT